MQKFWALVFGGVLLACFLSFAASPFIPGWWLPQNVCSFGPEVDYLFYLILGFTGFFFVLTLAILVVGLAKFGHDPNRKATFTHGSHNLEILWTAVPALILLFIAFAQVRAWSDIKYQSQMPGPGNDGAQVFEVTARMWEWRFRYPSAVNLKSINDAWAKNKANGFVPEEAKKWYDTPNIDDVHLVNEVHTWKGAKVRFMLRSRDVIHSFFLPNMRIKQDAMPGKVIPVWFDADTSNVESYDEKTGEPIIAKDKRWELACAELCGARHSMMRGKVVVHASRADYDKWFAGAAKRAHATQPEP